jgi:hypothetical protein
MSDFELLTAVGFGAIAVIIVSVLDFHVPYRISEIQNAVLRERYWFALAVYSTIAVIFYFVVLVICVGPLVLYLTPEKDDPLVTLALAIPPAIAAVFVIPHLPLLRDAAGAIRRAMQSLARFPQTVETLTALIALSPFKVSERAVSELTGELERYGVPPQLIGNALAHNNKVLAVGAATALQQVCSLHISFHDLRGDPRFKRFFSVRDEAFDGLEKHYRRVLRRSARALLIADDISASNMVSEKQALLIADDISKSNMDSEKRALLIAFISQSKMDSEDLALEVSDFIAQECEDLREKYHRLLAEATISGVSNRAARTGLVAAFGYEVELPTPLPLAPLMAIFAVDFLCSVAPIFFMTNMPEESRQQFAVSPKTATLAALAHGFGLTLSVCLAVFPKASTNFARPSLFALPWPSYVFFGLVSYLAGTVVLFLTYSTIELAPGWPAASHPLVTSLLFSVVFLVNTVVLSILLDVRLRNAWLDYDKARLRDGITLAVVMMSLMVVFMVGFLALLALYHMPKPPIGLHVYVLSILLFGVLGFVMGYLVPSTAQAYLEANKLTLRWAQKQGMAIGWATQRSHPDAPVVS